MEETKVFVDVPGFEGLYGINKSGDIFSYISNKTIKPYLHRDGYLQIYLCKNGKKKNIKIHRLVAQIFVPNINNKPQVNHKNGNKKDNYFENLEWCTPSENIKHAFKIGLKCITENGMKASSKNGIARRKLRHDDIEKIKKLHDKKEYSQRQLAKMFSVGQTAINRIVNNKTYLKDGV